MSVAARAPAVIRLPWRALVLLRDLVVGAVLCLTPLTSVLALGWLTRHMAHAGARPGWVLGERGGGWIGLALGGLAANIRVGLGTALGLAVWTLPFTLLWLGAWWAGWENSFNKGYEQAAVGPSVWLAGAVIGCAALVHLPLALAHAAAEGRVAAFFELRTIRRITVAVGWRGPALALVSVALSLPILGGRALVVFVEDIVPGFAAMSPEEQLRIAGVADLLKAGWSFAMLALLRGWAARLYRRGAERVARGQHRTRVMAGLWTGLGAAIWAALMVQIVAAQFMNYDGWLWLTHPVYLLPWPG